MSAQEKLRVDGIVKRFGNNEVLKGVSMAANAGDVISIIGSSGSGKSTWLRCMNLLEQPHEGTIALNGESLALKRDRDGTLTAADPKALERFRARLSMVFQHFNLWSHMTVTENVIEAPMQVLGLSKQEALERAERYLGTSDQVGVVVQLVYAQIADGLFDRNLAIFCEFLPVKQGNSPSSRCFMPQHTHLSRPATSSAAWRGANSPARTPQRTDARSSAIRGSRLC
jgi:ABC-type histidine transport system ATPase subunit